MEGYSINSKLRVGFEIDMNGIDYKDYIKNPDNYKIEKGKLISK